MDIITCYITDYTEESLTEWGNLRFLKSLQVCQDVEDSPWIRSMLKAFVVGQVPLQALELDLFTEYDAEYDAAMYDAAMLECISQMNKIEKLELFGLPDGFWTNDHMKHSLRGLNNLSQLCFGEFMNIDSMKAAIRELVQWTSVIMIFIYGSKLRKEDCEEISELLRAHPTNITIRANRGLDVSCRVVIANCLLI